MSSTKNRRGLKGVIATAGLALVATPLALVPSAAQAADPVTLTLININDFHGRIDSNTTKFATTIEQLRAVAGDANTLFMSAGDNIGASVFASASADDDPTIDVLNALDMSSSAVGNHEFDQGLADLTGDVMTRATWEYLGANVFDKGTTNPVLPTYKVETINGVRVGVIGAVTEETPSLVSPAGVATLDFGDMVTSVNAVADQLTDGNDANGEADVLVAEYHEGSGAGVADGADLASQLAKGGAFAEIVNGTSPKVDAIFTGHTHKAYAWEAPVPGATPARTRPVLQTGQYGENVGHVTLTVDPDDDSVVSYTAANVPRAATEDLALPRVQEVKTIVDTALAQAEIVGGVPKGTVAADITRAFSNGSFVGGVYTGGTSEDRGAESTIGNLVADSLRDTLADPARGGAEIGVVNPGGLRADLLYAGSTGGDAATNGDGVITYAEANAVLPFVNNLWTITLTGAQFKAVLEEQWQTNPDGTIPTRAFLHLGLSDNVSTTLDPSRPRGSRVTSVLVDGQPLDPAQEYRIGTFSFLAQGGDNFRTFADGTDVRDSGLIDRDAWIDYLAANQPTSPVFTRRQVFNTGLPARVMGERSTSFSLQKLNLTSLGSPENTTLTATLKPTSGPTTDLGSFPVTAGSADVSFDIPGTIPAGAVVELVAQPSGTTVTVPTGNPSATSTTARVVNPQVVVGATRARIRATVTPTVAGASTDGGTVRVYSGNELLGSGPVVAGIANVVLPRFDRVGPEALRVAYSGAYETDASEATLVVRVVRATPVMRLRVQPQLVRANRTHARVVARLFAPGQTVTGWLAAKTRGDVVDLQRLRDGRAVLTLPTYRGPGPKRVVVRYLGSGVARPVVKVIYVRVRR